jgi:hypothetical protein
VDGSVFVFVVVWVILDSKPLCICSQADMMNIQQQTMSKTTSQADMMNIQQQTMSKTTSQADMMNIQQQTMSKTTSQADIPT